MGVDDPLLRHVLGRKKKRLKVPDANQNRRFRYVGAFNK